MVKIYISSNPESLRSCKPEVTIEAEYGSDVVDGSLLTLAHHGERSGNPAPCLIKNGINGLFDKIVSIGISHIDLDTIGGIMAVLGIKPEAKEFWETAAFVDIAGPHKLGKIEVSEKTKTQLQAYWAWSKTNRTFAPKDGVEDVTSVVNKHIDVIKRILSGDDVLLKAGEDFAKEEEKLNKESFVEVVGKTVVRVSPTFCNHLYVSPSGEICDSVISYNTVTGAITLSFSEEDDRRNACDIMQYHFGQLAGGHKGIAGSPRGKRMRLYQILDIINRFPTKNEAYYPKY